MSLGGRFLRLRWRLRPASGIATHSSSFTFERLQGTLEYLRRNVPKLGLKATLMQRIRSKDQR